MLVDLDLRRPTVESFFGLRDHPGLTQVAIGALPLGKAIVRVPVAGEDALLLSSTRPSENGDGRPRVGCLDVLPSGPLPPDPGEFVGTDRLTEILEHLRSHSDIVLIDAPPLFHVGDGLVLSSKVDAVMVVTRMEVLRRRYRREEGEKAWIAPLATALQSGQIVYLTGSLFVGIAFQPFVWMLLAVQIGFDRFVTRKYPRVIERGFRAPAAAVAA